MKKVLAALLALTLVVPLAACGSAGQSAGAASSGAAASAAASGSASGSFTVPTDQKYNDMTADQLYEEAKTEDKTIVVYCSNSKLTKIADAFMKQYPELTVEINDLDTGESLTKVVTEIDAGNPLCDMIQDSDNLGDVAFNYYGKYVEAYYPTDICKQIDADRLTYGMPLYASMSYWYYNTAAFPDAAPVNNWWDIVETDASGKQKYALYGKDPGSEATYLALYSNFVAHPEELAKAYKDKYGKDVEYTYDASALGFEANNAGYEFLYRLSQMKMTFISDGDEIVEAVANSTKDAPALGLSSSGKLVDRDDNGWPIAWVTDLAPYTGTQNTSYVYTVTGCDSPAGARLFIRFMLGGDDGTGEGYQALMKAGNWSIRNDFTNDKNAFSLSDSQTIASDLSAVYNHYLDVSDFWTYWHDKSPNK
jgi:iron(III) transport system substrate-binding protein